MVKMFQNGFFSKFSIMKILSWYRFVEEFGCSDGINSARYNGITISSTACVRGHYWPSSERKLSYSQPSNRLHRSPVVFHIRFMKRKFRLIIKLNFSTAREGFIFIQITFLILLIFEYFSHFLFLFHRFIT